MCCLRELNENRAIAAAGRDECYGIDSPKMSMEQEGSLGWIVLNQPEKRNAVSQEMWQMVPEMRDLAKLDKMLAECRNSKDYQEGGRAFSEKRRPVFKGRSGERVGMMIVRANALKKLSSQLRHRQGIIQSGRLRGAKDREMPSRFLRRERLASR
jgi:hypothetical protein